MSALFEELKARLSEKPGQPFARTLLPLTLRDAAVLVPLFLKDGEAHVLVTKRPSSMRSHAGQISFPGGTKDDTDATLLHTALREADEELAIPQRNVTVLGQLNQTPTITGFLIHPFVGVVSSLEGLVPSPDEVELVLEVPLRHLLRPGIRRTETVLVLGRDHEMYFYDFGAHVIWGATAHILNNLFQLTRDLPAWQALTKVP